MNFLLQNNRSINISYLIQRYIPYVSYIINNTSLRCAGICAIRPGRNRAPCKRVPRANRLILPPDVRTVRDPGLTSGNWLDDPNRSLNFTARSARDSSRRNSIELPRRAIVIAIRGDVTQSTSTLIYVYYGNAEE